MFKFLRRRQFKKQTFERLYTLLFLYPGGPKNILKNYPGVVGAIDQHFNNDGPSPRAALYVAAAVIANELKALSPEDSALILYQLQRLDIEQFKSQLRELMAGKLPGFPEQIAYGTTMIGVAFIMANWMVEKQQISRDDFELFASEISGALQGKSADERSSERITVLLDRLFSMPEMG